MSTSINNTGFVDPRLGFAIQDDHPTVLFAHPEFYAVHKPPNIPFHSESSPAGEPTTGIVSLVKQMLDEEVFPVHRLDRVTSGLMLFARNGKANSDLSSMFEKRHISKAYVAIAQSKPNKKQGRIEGDMEKSRDGKWRLLKSQGNPARTEFRSKSLYPLLKKHWVFGLYPSTGKTHQLRVAMKSLSAPIKGDQRYGGGIGDRCYLHAYSLKFSYGGVNYFLTDPILSGQSFESLESADFLSHFLESKLGD